MSILKEQSVSSNEVTFTTSGQIQQTTFLTYFCQKIGFDISYKLYLKTGFDSSCKLSPNVINCLKCQYLSSGKNKKNWLQILSFENRLTFHANRLLRKQSA